MVFDEVGSRTFKAKVSGVARHSKIEIVLDSVGGEVIGTCPVPQTGDGIWQYVSCPIARTTGTHNVILKFYGNSEDNLLHIDKYKFVQDDGVHYGDAVAEGFGQGNTAQTEIRFPQQKGRFIKLDLTDPEDRIWTIYELNVWNIPGEEE
ncbi:Arabinoxylan arabinofuranohydrolase precursor [compost metagenome]